MHTNGIKIANFSYLKRLKYAGLNEVHLQLDGFEDSVYEKIRGEKLLQVKLKALENLERLNIATIRKCFYINHYIIIRSNGGYVIIDDVLDIESMQKNLENFKKMRLTQNIWATPYLIFSSLTKLIGIKGLPILREVVSLAIPFIRGLNLSALPKKSILIGFISACDSYSLDYEIAKNCGKGAISLELGINDSGAVDNVLRDKLAGKDYI